MIAIMEGGSECICIEQVPRIYSHVKSLFTGGRSEERERRTNQQKKETQYDERPNSECEMNESSVA